MFADVERIGKKVGEWTLILGALLMPLVILTEGYRVAVVPKFFVLMGVVLGVGVALLLAWRSLCWQRAHFALPWFLFLMVMGLQTLRSVQADAAVEILLLQVGGGIVGVGTALLIDSYLRMLRGVACAGVVVAILGILEYLGVSWMVFPSAGQPSATLGFRNVAAMYLIVGLFLSGALLFQKNKRDWWLGGGAVTLMVVFLIFTRTRGAWLGVVLAGVLGAWLVWRQGVIAELGQWFLQNRVVVLGVGLIVFALFVPPQFQDESLSRLDEKKVSVVQSVQFVAQEGGDRGRFKIWYHTLRMVADAPVFGVGHHNWSVYYPRYDQGETMGIVVAPKRPHNDFLWTWSELGIVGFLLYGWLLWEVAKQVKQHWFVRHWAAVLAGLGALALLIHSGFSFPREQPVAVFFLSLALGMAGQNQSAETKTARWWGIGVGSLALVVGIVGVVWGRAMFRFDVGFSRAFYAQEHGLFERQVNEAQQARLAGLFDHRVLLLEGLGRYALKDFQGAIAVYQTYLYYQPYLPAVHNNLGRAYEAVGNDEAAEKAYLKGLEIFSGDGAGILVSNLAAIYKRQGKVDAALALYEGAKSLPAEGHHNLGLIYAEQGLWERSLASYTQALVQDPNMTIVYFSMAGVQMLNGDIEVAAKNYETFLDLWNGQEDYVRDAQKRLRQIYPVLGDQYLRAQQFDDAGRIYERLLSLGDDAPGVLNNLVLINGQQGNFDKAIAFGQRCLQVHPQFFQMHLSLATVYEGWGKNDLAIVQYRKFLDSRPKNKALAQRAQQRLNALMKR